MRLRHLARHLFIAAELAAIAALASGSVVALASAWRQAAGLPTSLAVLAAALPAGIALRLGQQLPAVITTLRRWHGAIVRRLTGKWLFPRARRAVIRLGDWLTALRRHAEQRTAAAMAAGRKVRRLLRAAAQRAGVRGAERAEAKPGDAQRAQTQVAENATETAEIHPQGASRSQGTTCDNTAGAGGRFVAQDTAERFWAKVDRTTRPAGCWTWTGALDDDGYGRFRITIAPGRYRHVKAHRWAYENQVGPIAEGLTLDHLNDRCGNPACVRPDHLDPVPLTENIRRAARHRQRMATSKETQR